MCGKIYGYVRVSTKNQNEERQLIAMREYGVEEELIVVEKQSGKDFERPLYRELTAKLRAGDTLVIKSIDRLGRNYEEILNEWRVLSKEIGVSIVVLDMPLLNTRENQELVGQLVTDLVLQIFSYVAQNERENIRSRQAEGIAAAKMRGVRFGRPRIPMPENFEEVAELWADGDISTREAARRLNFSTNTFYRRVKEAGFVREEPIPEPEPETAVELQSADTRAESLFCVSREEVPSSGRKRENLPSLISGVTNGCRRPAASLSVVEREKQRGTVGHEAIAFQRTSLILCPADIKHAVREIQKEAVSFSEN